MSKYIEKDALKEKFRVTGDFEKDLWHSITIRSVIEEAPTVDAIPVVHGRWVKTADSYEDEHCKYNYWGCSACEYIIAGRYGLHRYCPNCGALMDLEESNV